MTHQVFPIHPNDLICDTCPARVPWMDTEAKTIERARVRGWRVYRGPSLTGNQISKTLCEGCIKSGKAKRPDRNAVLPDQMDMMEELGELRGRGNEVPRRGKRGGKGRVMA